MGRVQKSLCSFLASAAVLLTLAVLARDTLSMGPDLAWSDFRGGPGNPGSRDIVLVPEGRVPVLWSRTLSSGVTSPITGDLTGAYVGTMNGTLFKLDVTTGRTLWSRDLEGTIDAAPLIMDEGASVVAATSEGLVIALSAYNGSALWSWKAPTGGRVFSSPKELGERIYFGSYDSSFYCLFASNGSLSWSYPGCSGYIHTTPAIAQVDGSPVVLFGACDGTMNCLDATSGEVIWTFRTAYIPSSPSVSGGRVYFGSYDNKLFCLDLEEGTEVWNRSLPDGVYSSPAVLGEKVTVGCNDGNLYMVDALSGEVIWNRTMTEGALESSPLLFRDRVVVTTRDGMFLLDTEDGAVTRGFELGNAGDISPTYVGGSVLFGDSAGWVRAVTFKDVNGTVDDDDDGGEKIPIWSLLVLAMIAIPIILIIIYRIRLHRGNHRER